MNHVIDYNYGHLSIIESMDYIKDKIGKTAIVIKVYQYTDSIVYQELNNNLYVNPEVFQITNLNVQQFKTINK